MELFLDKMRSYSGDKDFDQARVLRALEFAMQQYENTEGSVEYCLKVVHSLLPLKPDEDTIVAVLLHDIYVNSFLNDEHIKELFGQSVLNLLVAFKKLSSLNYGQNSKSSQLEIFRKMFLTMAKDIRVILIWLSIRLSLLEDLSSEKDQVYKEKIAKETMSIYVPIASRLGIYMMKTQLEDHAFKFLHPEDYNRISKEIERFGKKRKVAISLIRHDLIHFLEDKGIKAEVSGRVKSVYSIHQKMQRKNIFSLDQMYDFFAIRIVIPEKGDGVDDLYSVLGWIHSEWRPVSSRFKDYVAVPKPNGYRSLHTVVLGLGPKDLDQPVEIQIRDEKMNKEAELGIASHWVYKTDRHRPSEILDSQIDWIKGLQHLDDLLSSPNDLVKEASLDLFRDRIFVLTPRGEVKDLPAGSIPIDFAYMIHTDVGNACVMAKVNSLLVPLDHELRNGDVVEIITRKDATPKLKWLSMVKSNFARQKIKLWFSGLNRENNIKEGRRLINLQLERIGQPPLDHNYSILKDYCGKKMSLVEREGLVEEIGKGVKIASDMVKKIFPYEKSLVSGGFVPRRTVTTVEESVVVGGEAGIPVKYASCCKPIFPNHIIAYITRGNRVTIHKVDCRLLDSLKGERIMIAHWAGEEKAHKAKYQIGIEMKVVSRIGLIQDITSVISTFGIDIIDIRIQAVGADLYRDCFLLEFDNLEHFDLLIDKLEAVQGVLKVSKMKDFSV